MDSQNAREIKNDQELSEMLNELEKWKSEAKKAFEKRDNVKEEKRKLEVMVKIFGRKTPLELNYMQVEKIS